MKIVKVATHEGVFHADEVYALAVLTLYLEKENKQIEITRTRDLAKVSLADMAVDVGGEYIPAKNKFDHHQKEKPGFHSNGIPYASLGLIWKHFGRKITPSKKVWESIEKKLIMPIDAMDNGVNISTPIHKGVHEYGSGQILSAISMAYGEEAAAEAFYKALEFAKIILIGEIKKAEAKIAGEKAISAEIVRQGEPEVLVLEKYYPWDAAVSNCRNIKLVIFPDKVVDRWCIQAARDNFEVFGQDRIGFPQEWRGLSDEDLVLGSGIADSVFCHTGGFFAVAKSKDAALNMALKTIAHAQTL